VFFNGAEQGELRSRSHRERSMWICLSYFVVVSMMILWDRKGRERIIPVPLRETRDPLVWPPGCERKLRRPLSPVSCSDLAV